MINPNLQSVTPKENRYPYLDALRGIAILLVILFHTSFVIYVVKPDIFYKFITYITPEGARGVQLFYIISALTLFLSLNNSKFTGTLIQNIKFFLRRFFRIAPLFYIIIISACILIPLTSLKFHLNPIINLTSVLSSITFTNNFFPKYINAIVPGQWSIAIEMFFYILVPIFFLRIKDLKTAKKYFVWSLIFTSIIELSFPIIFPIVSTDIWNSLLFWSIPIQIPHFILGFIAFFLIFKNENNESFIKNFYYLLKISLIVEIIFILLKYIISHHIDISMATPRVYIESIFLFGLVLLLSKGYLPILKNKVLQYIGKISFSIYLTHPFIVIFISNSQIYKNIAQNIKNGYVEYIFLFLISVLFSILICTVTFKLIEQPGQKLGMFISKKIVQRLEQIKR